MERMQLIEALEYCKNRDDGSCVSCPYPGLDCAIDDVIAILGKEDNLSTLEICPSCGRIASYNSYFNAYICNYCGWERRLYDSYKNH